MNLTKEDTVKAVEESIAVVLNTKPGEIQEDTTLIEELGMESIDFLDFGHELEIRLGLEINFEKLMESIGNTAITFGLLADYVCKEVS